MTIGIYALYWEEQDLIYIGQSVNIENRYKEHLRNLIGNKHTNYKVQNAYELYGNPRHIILEECLPDLLYAKEVAWTKEFNSLLNGLNIIEPGVVGYGPYSGYSKYSKIKVLKVFSLLYRTTLPYSEIASKLSVKIGLPQDISTGYSHTWLKEFYPEKYLQMTSNRNIRVLRNEGSKLGLVNINLVSPLGEVYLDIKNIKKFCENIPEFSSNLKNAQVGIGRIINKVRKKYRGWKLLT